MTENFTFLDTLKRYKIQFLTSLILLLGLYYSIISYMVTQWYNDENYSHGFLVPFIAGFFVYQRLDSLKKARVTPLFQALLIIAAGLLILIVGHVGTELFTMRVSLIIVLAGMVLYFFGKTTFQILLLPICFLFFMIPLPYILYDAIAFPLKLFIAKYSVLFLESIGIIILREGNIIMLPNITLEVADACSGIRSLMSLVTLSVALAFIINTTSVKRAVIIFSAVPIAIFTNALRVIITGILAQYRGEQVAEGVFHEFAGFMVFGVAVVILIMTGIMLKGRGKVKS
ncbi:MAG: exosortase [Nitrospira bacterium SG8_35_1]|nr:MAG: exosortase [Nitrospira bacterium SG8_35_1]